MSLLMEALRKAEETRRQTDGKGASAGPSTGGATVSAAEPATASSLPDLSLHLDTVDADLTAMSVDAARKRPLPGDDDQAEKHSSTRVVFAAKPPETTRLLWPIAGVGFLAALGVAGYFWWQLRAVQPPPPAAHPPAMPTTVGAPVYGIPSAPSAPIAESGLAPLPPAPEAAPPSPPAERPTAPARPSARAAENSTPVPAEAPPRPEPADKTPRLTRAIPRTNTPLERAYEALRSGRDEEARDAYERALQTDGRNTDALLGLATLAARRGRVDEAYAYYLRALETDPADATARAGVLSMGGRSDADAESLLTGALARQPGSPPLLFALGGLYARQQRWSEAQQSYFDAYAGEPDDPDIIFNLAVSLDHLRQDKLAARYYRLALGAADGRAAAFDRDRVKARLLELQP
ncbi:MAG: tetratricopeptide repeat protein [Candidatus Accumulibacter sp.]|jgi:tetratricopeptide (TPR) repeat protein|nr:tetratricopeptide repeat protein [Accumulibacter sp.]